MSHSPFIGQPPLFPREKLCPEANLGPNGAPPITRHVFNGLDHGIGRLKRREMSDAGQRSKFGMGKTLAKPIGPAHGNDRIRLAPHHDCLVMDRLRLRRRGRCLPGSPGPIIGDARPEGSGLGIGVHDRIELGWAQRLRGTDPMGIEMSQVGFDRAPVPRHQLLRERKIVQVLIPELPLGRGLEAPLADSWIGRVEQNESSNPARMEARHGLRDGSANIVAHHDG